MKMVPNILAAALCSACVTAWVSTDAWALYRWVDADGKVHYSDKLPPAQAGKERAKLNEEGMVVKKVEEAKSREELLAEKARQEELERLRQEQARLIEEQKAQDEVLLKTFQSENDITMARDQKLSTIDVAIQVLRSNIKRMKGTLEKQQKAAADLELAGKPVPKETLDGIEQLRVNLKDSYTSIITKEQEKEEIRRRFQLDLDRFRRLRNLQAEVKEEKHKEEHRFSLLETVVPCVDQAECATMWSKAEQYVRKYATTRIQMLSSTIIMTTTPVLDKDISITVSRLKASNFPNGAMLFLDVQCRESENGEALCKSPEVVKIRQGFRGEMAPSVTIDMEGMSAMGATERAQTTAQSPDILRRFIGRWKSDLARTMEGVKANQALTGDQKQRIEQILGKMVVNIRADAFSNYLPDTGTPAEFIPYQIVEAGENWIVISYVNPGTKQTETRKWFIEGDTIYSDLVEMNFREYYRRLD